MHIIEKKQAADKSITLQPSPIWRFKHRRAVKDPDDHTVGIKHDPKMAFLKFMTAYIRVLETVMPRKNKNKKTYNKKIQQYVIC